jgi:dCMP deaminase
MENICKLKKWDKRFLDLAKLISTWSKDPSTKVGSVICNKKQIVSMGYNGFPPGVDDNERLNNREEKYRFILHAENNAILYSKEPLRGCTIYTYPFMPCPHCTSMIIQSGIQTVVSYYVDHDRWNDNFKLSCQLLREAKKDLVLYRNTNLDYYSGLNSYEN